jgi:GntR family transcriptional regulator/MocR family aminotransferase
MFWIPIDRSLDIPLIRQVFEQIRTRILNGDLQAGEKLPSTRELAVDLHVSRNVTLEAYDQLHAEGYIETLLGSGTYVAEGTFLEIEKKKLSLASLNLDDISEENKKEENHLIEINTDSIDFKSGVPALDLFPRKTWAKLAHRVCNEAPDSVFGYNTPEGRSELRHVLSRYLLRTRGVYCHPDQLLITSGATQALTLIAKLLLSTGDEVIIEDPITQEIQTIFSAPGSILCPIPVDDQGMQTVLLPVNKKPSFVFVTPSHQFPLGGSLPIQRRIQLIQYARAVNCFIVEDDYDSEFRYEGAPVSSLQGLDPERVIYIGTFSKILSPGLRVGYLVLPSSIIEQCRKLKRLADLHTSSLDQLILAHFIDQGYLEKHVSKMKKLYRKRRKHLINRLYSIFSDQVNILGDSTGLHLIAEFKNIFFSDQLLKKIQKYGVKVYPVENHTIRKGMHRNRIILGYGHLTNEEITEGIYRLHKALL